MADRYLQYERCAFSTQLYAHRLYTAGHAWLERQDDAVWRVGFTEFAAKVLGEPVEFDFEVECGASVEAGQVIGWIEGLKAVTDLFAPLCGCFRGVNATLADRLRLVVTDPYGEGWLYLIKGTPGTDCVDVHTYVSLLDAAIEKIRRGLA